MWTVLLSAWLLVSPVFAQLATPKTTAQSVPVTVANPKITNPLVDFGFGIDGLRPAEQVQLLTRLGYQGLVLTRADVAAVRAFAELDQVKNGSFRIYSMLWWAKQDEPLDSKWLDTLLQAMAKTNTSLWIVIEGKKHEQDKAVTYLRRVAEQCKAWNVQMVLYPHAGTVFEDVEEQLEIWQKLDRKEVRLSIHLCHELMHGNADRISQIIPKVAPLLVLASINGAELGRNDGWDSLIMPLDKGSYDPRGYLKALVQNGYNGPMVLHTYGIKDRPEDHLTRSMDRWNQMTSELASFR